MKHEPTSSHTKHYAQRIWLASLGTVDVLQKKGRKVFNELVKEGKSAEARSKARGAKRRAKVGHLTETVVAKKVSYQKQLEAQLQDWDNQLDQLMAKAKIYWSGRKQSRADSRRPHPALFDVNPG